MYNCRDDSIAAWVNFPITLSIDTDNVSEQRFVRCYHFEQCLILRAMTAKTEMTLRRQMRGELRWKGKTELRSCEEGRYRGMITGREEDGEKKREARKERRGREGLKLEKMVGCLPWRDFSLIDFKVNAFPDWLFWGNFYTSANNSNFN